jgi:uracil-DNA glycosylase
MSVNAPAHLHPEQVRIVMICEALPAKAEEYFYSGHDSLATSNIMAAFNQAGIPVTSMNDIIKKGVYITVAVQEPRQGLVVPTSMIAKYQSALAAELSQFPHLTAILLMGDAAIKAMNLIAKNNQQPRVIPTGSTYKIRGGKFYWNHIRVFPSYLPTGKNFLIEKSKQVMVAEDIRSALALIN